MLNLEKYIKALNCKEKANFKHAMSWKQNSKDLFDSSFEDKKAFEVAVLWCGVNGNVVRTVNKDNRPDFIEFLWNNRYKIRDGHFELTEVKSLQGPKPFSWISKICHIINPKKHPIIYDEKVRQYFGLKGLDDFLEKLKEIKSKNPNETNKVYYELDSLIWAIDSNDKKRFENLIL